MNATQLLTLLIQVLLPYALLGQQYLYQPTHLQAVPKQAFMLDDEGLLWLATSKGVFYYNGLDWRDIQAELKKTLSSQTTWSITQDKQHNIWLGYAIHAPQRISPTGVLDTFSLSGDGTTYLQKAHIFDLKIHGDTILAGTDFGLLLLSADMKYLKRLSFHNAFPQVRHGVYARDIIRVIEPDSTTQGRYWVGGIMGLASVDVYTGQWAYCPMPTRALAPALEPSFNLETHQSFMVTDMEIAQGVIYCATWGGGLMAYDIKQRQWNQHLFQPFTPDVQLDENIISRLDLLGDSMLVGTTQLYKKPVLWHIANKQFVDFEQHLGVKSIRDDADAVKILGNQIWMGYTSGVERYTIKSNNNTCRTARPAIAKLVQSDSILYERTFLSKHIGQQIEIAEGTLRIHFAQLADCSATYEFQLLGYDSSPRKGFSVSYELPGGRYDFKYRLEGQDKWQHLKILKEKVWHERTGLIITMALLLSIIMMGIGYLAMHQRAKKIKAKLELSNTMLELERRALQAQMNPHFLFNSLVSIKSFIVENDRRKATDFINEFAAFVRQLLNYSQLDSISLTEELEMIQLYLNIEQKRFRTAFQYNLQVQDGISLNDIPMPSLLLQPFVENALWHGIMHVDYPGQIDLKILQEDAFLCIQIIDNGMGISKSMSQKSVSSKQKSYGSSISQKRLVNYFGPQASISIQDRSDMSGTIVCIKILWNSIHEKRVHHV